MTIREAQPADEEAIIEICFESRRVGRDRVEDPEIFALRWALYYLRYEREFCFVAEEDGQVIGYILSTADTERQEEGHLKHIAPLIKEKMAPDHPDYDFYTTLMKKRDTLGSLLDEYPAHLHINLTARCRGKGVGTLLMKKMEENMVKHGVKRIHLGVINTNLSAIGFYEKKGYQEIYRHTLEEGKSWVLFMGKTL